MQIQIYSKPNCIWCDRAKKLLSSKNFNYTERCIGTDLTKEQFKALFPDKYTVPQIIIDGNLIGGYTELEEYFDGGYGEQGF